MLQLRRRPLGTGVPRRRRLWVQVGAPSLPRLWRPRLMPLRRLVRLLAWRVIAGSWASELAASWRSVSRTLASAAAIAVAPPPPPLIACGGGIGCRLHTAPCDKHLGAQMGVVRPIATMEAKMERVGRAVHVGVRAERLGRSGSQAGQHHVGVRRGESGSLGHWRRRVYRETMEAIILAVGWLPAGRLLIASGRPLSEWACRKEICSSGDCLRGAVGGDNEEVRTLMAETGQQRSRPVRLWEETHTKFGGLSAFGVETQRHGPRLRRLAAVRRWRGHILAHGRARPVLVSGVRCHLGPVRGCPSAAFPAA